MKSLVVVFLVSVATLSAAIDAKVDRQLVHEALISKANSLLPIEVISRRPPGAKEEKPPAKMDPRMIWIHGYWGWDREKNDFEWVCGIWRFTPPDQTWVPGYWKEDNGWYWVPGMWHNSPSNAVFTQQLPPENPEEEVESPPGDSYFWASGHWEYNPYEKNFRWFKGSWQPFDDNWILVPAIWQFREAGYSFRPAYWDYPLEKRGIAYDCNKEGGYEPVSYRVIISRIYSIYPDYSCFFSHHFHYHKDFWNDCWCTPPWWGWNNWWSFNYLNQWSLWWWWSHPGFNAPVWMNAALAAQIIAPEDQLTQLLKGGKLPFFFALNGVPTQDDWVKVILGLTGKAKPLLPDNLWDEASKNLKPSGVPLRPSGTLPLPKQMPKPKFENSVVPFGSAVVPGAPRMPEAQIPPKPKVVVPPATYPPKEVEGGTDIWGEPNVRWPDYRRPGYNRPENNPQPLPERRPRYPVYPRPNPKPKDRPIGRPTNPPSERPITRPNPPSGRRPDLKRPIPPKYRTPTWIEKESKTDTGTVK